MGHMQSPATSPFDLFSFEFQSVSQHKTDLSQSGWGRETGGRGGKGIDIINSFIDSLSVLHLGHNFHKVQAVKKK